MFTVTQLAIEAETEGLQLPQPAKDGRYNTMNEKGAMSSKISQSDELFIEIASRPKAKVLEIGCAYGLVCVEALKRGAEHYVAVDLEIKHLEILAKRVLEQIPESADALTLIPGAFPYENVLKHLERNSFDAILTNLVLHFLSEKEVKEAFRQFALLLKPGGRLIATMGTANIAFLKQEVRDRLAKEVDNFLNAPDEKKPEMVLPGYMGTTGEVFDLTEEVLNGLGMTTRVHVFYFDPAIVKYLLEKESFIIEKFQHFSLNEMWNLDNKKKDHIMVVAQKSENV